MYGKSAVLKCADTEGCSPDVTPMLSTSENIASGALSASVRPLMPEKPYVAGVPTVYGRASWNNVRATVCPYPSGSSDDPVAATTRAIDSPMYFPSALRSADGCRSLAGLEKSVSSGQKIGHIIGWPKRLICRQPPASVASFVAHHTPMCAPARSRGCWRETSSTIDSTVVFAKLFCALSACQPDSSTAVPFLTAPLMVVSRA